MTFKSEFKHMGSVELPIFSNTRVMMVPVLIGDTESLPDFLAHYKRTVSDLFNMSDIKTGVGYLTIDEKKVKAEFTHRREGLHVDGIYQGRSGGWGGGGGGWGTTGMLTVASRPGCRAWVGEFEGYPGMEGECDHLRPQLGEGTLFGSNEVYWLSGMCVHESVPMAVDTERTFVRLSMPSDAPWFEGYTVNPKGVLPAGPILPRRSFMDM